MQQEQIQRIPLNQVQPHPDNPRKRFEGTKFNELAKSIAQKGVISPILVRPLPGSGDGFQIIFGERRFRASLQVAEGNGGADHAAIPAMVRDLSDEEAFDLMTIENLQREDLTELEEAECFQTYLKGKGKSSLLDLADRTGIHPAYIRRRMAVLKLPKRMLKKWDAGELKFGHLEQLIRVKSKDQRHDLFKQVVKPQYGGGLTVKEMKSQIDSISPPLKKARFDRKKARCARCSQNSDVQKQLFELDTPKGLCLNPKCFKQHQNNWLIANWETTGWAKKHKTNGFRFDGDLQHGDYGWMYYGPYIKCADCESFVTLLNLDGSVREKHLCLGPRKCYEKLGADKSQQPGKAKSKAKADPDTPRVAWHGEYFREKFFSEQIPLRVQAVDDRDLKVKQLSLFALFKSNSDLQNWFALETGMRTQKQIDKKPWEKVPKEKMFTKITEFEAARIEALFKEASIQVAIQDQTDTAARRRIAGHFGIDLATEWVITEEYLHKKTKAEMMVMGEKLGVFEDPAAQTFLYETLLKKRGKFSTCKKPELIRVFLESGVELKGKVPAEILAGEPGKKA